MWERSWIALLAALTVTANLLLGNGTWPALGAGIVVLVFGALAWRFSAPARRPNRRQRGRLARIGSHPSDRDVAEEDLATAQHRRSDWVAEVGTGLAFMGLGVAALALPQQTPLIGTPSWVGLGAIALGLAICLLSTGTYFRDRVLKP